MQIVHISDTHGKHNAIPPLPEGDILVHSGDITWNGTMGEVRDFITWFAALPYQHKIFIAGNHDICLRDSRSVGELPVGVHYLCSSATVIDGVSFFGLPFFQKDVRSGKYDKQIGGIPSAIDVLISHQPPFGILDGNRLENYGSKALKEKVEAIEPTLHLFGHIHNAYGSIMSGKTLFSNGAVLDNTYHIANPPQTFEI